MADNSVSYKYVSNGMRTQKTDNGDTTYYYYDSNKNLIALTKGNYTLLFYYDSDGNVTSFKYNGTMYYYIKNLQGDVVKIINQSGTECVSYVYDAWGNTKSASGNPILRELNPFRYRSYVYDEETGLYYLQSRYYDPFTGRFLNADDTAFIGATGTILSTNMFAYCENNPIVNVDHSGYIAHNVVGAVVGALLNIGIYMISVWMGIESFSWWGFSWTVICGLASGAFAASSLRRAVQIVINISLSVASNICNYIRKTKKPSVEGIITEIVIGCIVGLVAGYVGGHGNGKLFKKASNSYVKKWISCNRKAILNGTKYYIKSFKNLLFSRVIKPIFKSFVSGLIADKSSRKTNY